MPPPAITLPELTIALTRCADASTVFRLTRADGSVTWQRTRGATGAFFPGHDLTHYAVETVLGHTRGFYGLVADGWDLDSFAAPWPRGRLVDIDPSELIVGFVLNTGLDRSGLADGTEADAGALNAAAMTFFASPRTDPASAARWRDLGNAQLAAVRTRARVLVSAWDALPAGGTLTLRFDRLAFDRAVARQPG
ncbi:MAG TPA: hypothetical protein VGD56_06185 [Gemmatirosa sp.]